MTNKTLIKKLKAIEKEIDNDLEKYVIDDILSKDNPEEYIKGVLNHGCVSGMVSSLIYYTSTKAFYIKFMEEIEELYQDTTEEIGEPLVISYPMYNWFAWFGYEQTLYKLADKLVLNN